MQLEEQSEGIELRLLLSQIVAAFLKVPVELVREVLALYPYSWEAVPVEHEDSALMRAGDAAVSLSYFNHDLTTTIRFYELFFRVFPNLMVEHHIPTI